MKGKQSALMPGNEDRVGYWRTPWDDPVFLRTDVRAPDLSAKQNYRPGLNSGPGRLACFSSNPRTFG